MKKQPKVPSAPQLNPQRSAFRPDTGPQERWQHSGRLVELTDQAGVCVARSSEESVLDVLLLKGQITVRQKEAALRLRADYLRADMGAHLVSSYSPVRFSHGYYCGIDDRSDAQEVAYQNWRRAVSAVGALYADRVIDVACEDMMPDDQQILIVQIGLYKLAKWYGIPERSEEELYDDIDKASARQIAVSRDGLGNARRGKRLLH